MLRRRGLHGPPQSQKLKAATWKSDRPFADGDINKEKGHASAPFFVVRGTGEVGDFAILELAKCIFFIFSLVISKKNITFAPANVYGSKRKKD